MKLKPNEKMDVKAILEDLENYHPQRRGWVWREKKDIVIDGYSYKECSDSLKNYVALPAAARYFSNLDPQPNNTITTEIASGRFEDDIRRMRMAAWHGADHIMVIRTAGQSHFDGLIEGTPQGIGGVPITRKQVRAHRKACDMIEEEVGRAINYHSYISGVAGPEVAVMFAEEGVNGAHQDPQYNVLYRNVNMYRSFVDAGESKKLMAWADMAQIDGAHNANATAKDGWRVMPELMVQHGLNSIFSYKVGLKKENICLSTVPPSASPTPCLKLDLPYAVALRDFFDEYRMRAQMNTKYITSSSREATVTHVMNMLISRLTRADIQSTITPDEGRNVPWHMYNIEACDTAKQSLVGMDDLLSMVELRKDGYLPKQVRELKERAVLFLEEIIEAGGYFEAVEKGFFVDSGYYPQRNGDGIGRKQDGGVGAGTVFKRDEDYMAPVTAHFGNNNIAQYGLKETDCPSTLIDGCTLEKPEKIVFIDELDEEDNVNRRMEETDKFRNTNLVKPEVEWLADGVVQVDEHPFKIVAATVGEDEHSVGLKEVIDIKHGGIEKFGMEVEYLGTSVPCEKLVDAAIELNADVILASTIISHDDIHYKNMKKLHDLAVEKGIREKVIICAGGTQVTPEIAREQGMDEGFGKYDRGVNVATFFVKRKKEMLGKK